MTLQELADKVNGMLEDGADPESNVLLMSQPSWPFEYSIAGVTSREELLERNGDNDSDPDSDDDDDEGPEKEWGAVGSGRSKPKSKRKRDTEREGAETDIFLVEGRQLRYGSKAAWDAV